jgi:hypothetical protein
MLLKCPLPNVPSLIMKKYLVRYSLVCAAHSCTSSATQASPNSNFHLLIVVDIDDRLLPFASRDTTLEQNVDLTEGPVLHLWNPDPSHDGADKGGASPDVAALAAQVPLISVEHVAGKEDARNIDQVVGTSSDTGCEWPETNGRCLADDDP